MTRDLAAEARAVIDGTRYAVLGTADADGNPWTTPVYVSHDGYAAFYWVSSPAARHSVNIAVRPQVSAVVFDSQVPVGGAEAVYVSGTAAQVLDDELERCAPIFQSRDGFTDFGADQLRADDAPLRLYRLVADEHFLLVRGSDPLTPQEIDGRVPVDPRR
jgi:nitroimidazol reductase NimA-like FMN-containing flavoprotein (pyridoxamine 5'-phosphate oxidase superfamily)